MVSTNIVRLLALVAPLLAGASAFAPSTPAVIPSAPSPAVDARAAAFAPPRPIERTAPSTSTRLYDAPDLDVVSLVAGQETYGFAIVAVGEALWSFLQAPSFDHAKVLVPGIVAALVLVAYAGPAVTSGDPTRIAAGLEAATFVSILLGGSYVARMAAPYSPSPKEIAFLGLLTSVAGFFSFSQNLVVDGFVSLPNIPLPSLPMPTGIDWDALLDS